MALGPDDSGFGCTPNTSVQRSIMSDLIDRSDDPQLGRSLGLSRRQLLAATTGMAAAAAIAGHFVDVRKM